MNIIYQLLQQEVAKLLNAAYQSDFQPQDITITETPKHFSGDCTVVIFPLAKKLQRNPNDIALLLQTQLQEVRRPELAFAAATLEKGFLNLTLTTNCLLHHFGQVSAHIAEYGTDSLAAEDRKKVVLEYCGPNTNKPLHLGHLRNMMVGWSVAELLKTVGHEVVKVNILNDRGIAICKSMVAWLKSGNGITPAVSGIKGDHFVGDFYVAFDKMIAEEYGSWQQSEAAQQAFSMWLKGKNGEKAKKELETDDSDKLRAYFFKEFKNDYFNQHSTLGAAAKDMLLRWEENDPETRRLWQTMNDWVLEGFQVTYNRLGIDFQEEYKESEYYLRGKELVMEALSEDTVYQKPDGSIWVDLTDLGLDHKILLRSDGTSVYLTQDLGVAEARYEKYHMDSSIYTVADEQNYHFQALKKTLQKMNKPYGDGIFHLAYGMVDLPSGRMKSREGTVVDADDLVDEVVDKVRQAAEEADKTLVLNEQEAIATYETLGVSAIKFFLLLVEPKKRMIFNPEESVNIHGTSAAFVQYSYARTRAVLRKYGKPVPTVLQYPHDFEPSERELLLQFLQYPSVVADAAAHYNPSLLAQYVYHLAKNYNRFFAECSILNNADERSTEFRVQLSAICGALLQKGLHLLGIQTVERM